MSSRLMELLLDIRQLCFCSAIYLAGFVLYMLLFIQSIVCLTFAYTYTDNRAYVIAKQTFKPQCLYNRHSTPTDYDNRDCVLHPQNSARNPLIVRAESSKCPRGYMRIFRAVVCGKS